MAESVYESYDQTEPIVELRKADPRPYLYEPLKRKRPAEETCQAEHPNKRGRSRDQEPESGPDSHDPGTEDVSW